MDPREIDTLVSYLRTRWQLVRHHLHGSNDRGDIVQTAIIIAGFAAAALLIVGILVGKARETADNVKTQ